MKFQEPSLKLREGLLSEINLDEDSLKEGVNILRKWLQLQPHLPHDPEEGLLKAFILGAKSVERAKVRLDGYYTVKLTYPYLFSDWNPKNIREKYVKLGILPGVTKEGWKILFLTMGGNIEDHFQEDNNRKLLMILLVMLRDFPFSSNILIVLDSKNMSMDYLLKTSAVVTAQALRAWQQYIPMRLKGFVVFNAHPAVDILMNKFVKPFLSEKIKERVLTYREDHTALEPQLRSLLPEDFDGDAPPMDSIVDYWDNKLEEESEWLMAESMKVAVEEKRIVNINDENNLHGTFRKLTID